MPACAVVLLETHPESAFLYTKALMAAGFHVIAAHDASEAYRHATERSPSAVVASFDSTTRQDRLELCRVLKAASRTGRIPTLLVSRTMEADIVREAAEAGALALAVMPPDGGKLVSAVQSMLAAHLVERAPGVLT
jgi:PleD family two-component response regulator